ACVRSFVILSMGQGCKHRIEIAFGARIQDGASPSMPSGSLPTRLMVPSLRIPGLKASIARIYSTPCEKRVALDGVARDVERVVTAKTAAAIEMRGTVRA